MTGLRNATVFVVLTPRGEGHARDMDLEVLDTAPGWEQLPGQVCYVANIDGGDSTLWQGWHGSTDPLCGACGQFYEGHHECELDDTEECPTCGMTRVVEVAEGAPSMMGYGTDPDVTTLACGHRLTWDPFTGEPLVLGPVHQGTRERGES